MDYPIPVTVHFYEFQSLSDAISAQRIDDSNLPEYTRFTVTCFDDLQNEWAWHYHHARTCCIVETNHNIISSGLISPEDCHQQLVRYFLDRNLYQPN